MSEAQKDVLVDYLQSVRDAVVWKRPAGDLELEILSISYPK